MKKKADETHWTPGGEEFLLHLLFLLPVLARLLRLMLVIAESAWGTELEIE